MRFIEPSRGGEFMKNDEARKLISAGVVFIAGMLGIVRLCGFSHANDNTDSNYLFSSAGSSSTVRDIGKDHPAYQIRIAKVRALGRLPSTDGIDVIKNYLRDDPHPYVRLAAAEVLGKKGEKSLASEAAWREATPGNPLIRRARAVEVLGQIADVRNLTRLVTISKDLNEPHEVRFAALRALSNTQFCQLRTNEERLVFLRKAILTPETTRWAIGRLTDMRTTEGAQVLLDAARTTEPYGTPQFIAKHFAMDGLYALYRSNRQIQHMLKTGKAKRLS
jgi:hypothetical protein